MEQTVGIKSDSKLRVHQKSTTFYAEKNVKPMYIDAQLPQVKNITRGTSNNETQHYNN